MGHGGVRASGPAAGTSASPDSPCRPQYRLAPIPRARHYFACASLIFVCILLVHVLLMPRSAGVGGMGRCAGVGPGGQCPAGPPEHLCALPERQEGAGSLNSVTETWNPRNWIRGCGPTPGVTGAYFCFQASLSRTHLTCPVP